MAVEVSKSLTKVQLAVKTGENSNGDPVTKTMTLSKIKLSAADQDLFDVAQEVKKLVSYPVLRIEKAETSLMAQI